VSPAHPARRPRRVSVVGTSGSGKTTLARRIADTIGGPHLELDAVNHQPGWQPLPEGDFAARVGGFTTGTDTWVVDGNYAAITQAEVWPRADTVVWLDLPRSTVMRQLAGRSLKRVVTREALWNGNRESLRNLLSWDPQRSVMRWAWTSHPVVRERNERAAADPTWSHLEFVRLTGRAAADEYVRSLAPPSPRPA
jgi:adenylate kinase family enzyme